VREESWDFGFGNWDLRKRKNLPQRWNEEAGLPAKSSKLASKGF
jgi:hypothetical protein